MKYLLAVVMVLCAVTSWAGSGDYVAPTANYDQGDWIQTDSIYASDDRRSTNAGTNQHKVGGKTFGIAVTDGATIDSIIVKIEGSCNGTLLQRQCDIQLSKDGGATGAGEAVLLQFGTSEAVSTVRGITNGLWNTTWTEAEIESANFCVTVKKNSSSATPIPKVDQITVAVWWTASSGFSGNRREKIISMGLTKPK